MSCITSKETRIFEDFLWYIIQKELTTADQNFNVLYY